MLRFSAVFLALLLLLYPFAVVGQAPTDVLKGEPLQSALEKYRTAGARLVYTTTLVRAGLLVASLPDPAMSMEEQLRSLLEPHALTLTLTDAGIWAVVALPATLAETPVLPSEPAVTDTVEELLVISPRHRLFRTDGTAQSLTSSELQSIPSAGRDLFRAVASLPGQAGNGVSVRPRIRGGNENEVLYLIDGAQFIEPFHMGDYFSPFSALNGNIVDTVDVYNAGFPSRYGNRSGAVIDLIIAETAETFAGAVDVDLLSTAVHAQGAVGGWQWLASARRSTLDLVLQQFQEDYGKPFFHDEMLRLTRESGSDRLVLGLLNSKDEISLRNPTIRESGDSDAENLMTWAVWEFIPGDRTELVLRGNYTRIRAFREGTLDNPVDAVGELDESRHFDVYRFTLDWSQQLLETLALHTGIEYQHHRGEFSGRLETAFGPLGLPIQPLPGFERSFDTTRKGEMVAVHAAVIAQITPRLEAEFGLRYDNQDIDPVHDSQLSPRLQVNYRLGERFTLFMDLGRYVQHQYLYEIQLDDGLLELAPPQRADQLSIGARMANSDALEAQVEIYSRRIDTPETRFDNLYNRYVLLPELHADRVSATPERARARGIELTFSGALRESLFWRASYVFADVEERFDGIWRPRPWDQHHTLKVGLDWQRSNWRFGMHTTYHTGWATTDLITEPGVSIEQYNQSRLKDFVSMDLSLSRSWQFASSSLEAYLEVSNVTNRRNIGGYDYSLDDDSGWQSDARLLLPVLPVLGLKYQW